MKKKYMNPEMEIVNIKIQQHFLAGSVTDSVTETSIDPNAETEEMDAPGFGGFDFDF